VTPRTLVVATRSEHKLRELLQMMPVIENLRFLTLDEAGIAWSPEEEKVEAFDTFEQNALAKARFFHRASGHAVLADDSGLCVDALNGEPGVRSKRFSGRTDLSGLELDRANNQYLLDALDASDAPRTARFVCAIALVTRDEPEALFRGTVEGVIADHPSGDEGFGYDPLFFLPSFAATLGELPAEVKNRISHRKRALDRAIPHLRKLADSVPNGPAFG
jgi:XTP/dITP diphosphohydrolase